MAGQNNIGNYSKDAEEIVNTTSSDETSSLPPLDVFAIDDDSSCSSGSSSQSYTDLDECLDFALSLNLFMATETNDRGHTLSMKETSILSFRHG